VAAWLVGQRSSAVAGDEEGQRAGVLMRRRRSGDGKARMADVLVRQRGSSDGKARRADVLVRRCGSGDALGRARTAGRGVFGQRRVRRSLSGGSG
jgi:hypothetical protein